jgi:molybdenum cofactor cytidylyltransferase
MVRHSGEIYGVFLAAGQSRRMGCPKLELPFLGGTVGNTSLSAACASNLDSVLVITELAGKPSWLRQESSSGPDSTRYQLIPCKDAAKGQSFSLQCGVRAAQRLGAEAIVVLLADQPLLTPTAIDELLDEYHKNAKDNGGLSYIAASCEGSGLPMPPVLFPHTIFPELLKLTGDQGARSLLRRPIELEGVHVEFRDADLFLDIDTPEDYTSLVRRASSSVYTSG